MCEMKIFTPTSRSSRERDHDTALNQPMAMCTSEKQQIDHQNSRIQFLKINPLKLQQMKKNLLIIMILGLSATVFAQEYKLPKSTGKLEIKEVNNVTIEGYNGNEIVFSSLDGSREKDRRSDGLRAVSAMGLEDNTGIGLSVKEEGGSIKVYQLKKMDGPRVKIMVPKGVSIYYSHSSPHG